MIEIRPATLRDLTYVACNLRPEDRQEVYSFTNLETGTEVGAVTWQMSGPEWSWAVLDGSQPMACFGLCQSSPFTPQIWTAWAWGTPRMKRALPAISRFARETWPELLLPLGVNRVEVRSIAGHKRAHRWLRHMGARFEGYLPECGLGGETFLLFAWRASEWRLRAGIFLAIMEAA